MKWYAAHILICTKLKSEKQDKFPVWENVVLIEASSPDEAYEKAEKKGREYEGDSGGSHLYENKPASEVFVGIRKIIECVDSQNKPGDGTEVSYSRMEVADEKSLKNLSEGKPVRVLYEE